MPFIKYRVPYEVVYHGLDVASSKPAKTVFFVRNGIQVVGLPAYGSVIPAPSDLELALTNIRASWLSRVLPLMSVNYRVDSYDIRAVTGWTTLGLPRNIAAASNEPTIVITTHQPHGFEADDVVVVADCQGNTAANGTWVVTIINDTQFSIPAAGNGAYTGGGTVRIQTTFPRLTYGDTASLPSVAAGGDFGLVGGDALPVFATMSVQKKTGASGRNFRGGMRLSPVGESDSVNGAVTPARHAVRIANWNLYRTDIWANGGADAGSGFMDEVVFSRNLAFQALSPFAQSLSFCSDVASYSPRPNDGSILRRKPKLNAPISQ